MKIFSFLGDTQDVGALAWCSRCGMEIYREDPVGEAGGGLLHLDCMTAEEQEYSRFAPARSFFTEVSS